MNMTWTQRLRFVRALQHRSFALLWLGQTTSMMGDGAYATALAWQVLVMTGSASAMGIVLVAANIPMIVLTLIGGVAADRLPRRLVLLVADAGRAVAVLAITVLGIFHLLQLWHLIVLSLLFGVAKGFFYPAYRSIPPQLVVKESLPSANGLVSLSEQIGDLVGPLLGAFCVVLAGPISGFAFDGLTFIVSALCLAWIRYPGKQEARRLEQPNETGQSVIAQRSLSNAAKSVLKDIREGFSYVLHSRWLSVSILIAAVANVGLSGSLAVALPKLVYNVYNSGVWSFGVIVTADSLGIVSATFLVGQIRILRRRGLIAYLAMALCGLALVIFGIPLPHSIVPVVAIIAGFILGCSIGFFSIIWITVIQELVPEDILGRVNSIDLLGSLGLLSVGYAVVGILVDHIGPTPVFIASGGLIAVLALLALCVREIRRLD